LQRRDVEAQVCQALAEGRCLAGRADHPQAGAAALAQQGLGDGQVEVVAVRHHAHMGAVGAGLGALAVQGLNMRRHGREGLVQACVDPTHPAGDVGQQAHDGTADMAGAVELQVEARRRQACGRRGLPVGERG
jgi:hypothetical protein